MQFKTITKMIITAVRGCTQ